MHRRQRQDLGPLLLSELARDDAAHSRSDGLAGLVDEHAGVVVELDHAAVGPLPLLRCPHHDGVSHISSSDLVRCADGHAVAGLGAEVALLLDNHHHAIACVLNQHLPPTVPSVADTYQLSQPASIAAR